MPRTGTGAEDIFRCARAVVFSGAFRAAGENNTVRIEITDLFFSDIPMPTVLPINADFTDTARDQLSVPAIQSRG